MKSNNEFSHESAVIGLFEDHTQDPPDLDMRVEDWVPGSMRGSGPETKSFCQLQIENVYSLASKEKPSLADVDTYYKKVWIKEDSGREVSSLDSGSEMDLVKTAAAEQSSGTNLNLDSLLVLEELDIVKDQWSKNVISSNCSKDPSEVSPAEDVLEELFLPVHFTGGVDTASPDEVSSSSDFPGPPTEAPEPQDPLRETVPQRISVIVKPCSRPPALSPQEEVQEKVQEGPPPVKRGRGRPKGSKNKKKKKVSQEKKFCERCVVLGQICR